MIEQYFESPRTIRRLHQGPLGGYMDAFAGWLHIQGYSRTVARTYLRDVAHWSRYAMWCGVTQASDLSQELAQDFIENHLPNCSCERINSGAYSNAAAAVKHILNFLIGQEIIEQPVLKASPYNEMSSMLVRYDTYLDELVGLCQKTRNIHRRMGLQFMEWLKEEYNVLDLSSLTNNDIVRYQEACQNNGFSADWKRTLTSCLRAFLRFLRWERILEKDLSGAVYPINAWSFASLPKYMSFEDVKLILSMPDRSTATGKRDVAMLVLMAYLGLRANEVVKIQTADIDFAKGALLIQKTKTQRERILPLTNEIAAIMLDYIENGRGLNPSPQLFLKTVAPYSPLIAPSSAGTMIRKYIKQAGIKTPTLGTHQLRHSLATHLINNGVSIKEIADLLGHTSVESTGIYAKVQVDRLKEVALPFPAFENGGEFDEQSA